ncbi:energy transducer TonB [Lysobacter cavernae]|uniref:Energy transducer TonB n=1 Tax=Lysobacter cavernae TaxID=1685901 RepID=A0ABV7RQ45_9GAMM
MTHAIALPSHRSGAFEPPRLDGNRIVANAGALAVNAALLLLLLVPLTAPQLLTLPRRDDNPVLIQVVRAKPKPITSEPVPVPVVPKTARQPAVTTPQPRIETPPLEPVADSQPGDEALAPADPVGEQGVASLAPTLPQAGAQLQTLSAPPPAYPGAAVRDGLTGTVELEILVDVDGKPIEARVVRSSGHRVLDQAARRVVLTRWTFEPALQYGRPVQALGRVPIEFKLD